MNKFRVLTHSLFAVAFAVLVQKTSFAEPANLSHLKAEVQAFHDSGLYQRELSQIIMTAHDYLARRVVMNEKSPTPEKLALVLDIDETSISNYEHMVTRDFSGDKECIHSDILLADAPAIKPMLSLYNDAVKHGVAVFFVTGRNISEQKATETNLKAAGYHDWSGLYFKPTTYKEHSVIGFKSNVRSSLASQGYTVVASIGDQYSDLKGGFAEKTFKLPNPYYYIP